MKRGGGWGGVDILGLDDWLISRLGYPVGLVWFGTFFSGSGLRNWASVLCSFFSVSLLWFFVAIFFLDRVMVMR